MKDFRATAQAIDATNNIIDQRDFVGTQADMIAWMQRLTSCEPAKGCPVVRVRFDVAIPTK